MEKELIILAHYVCVGHSSPQKVRDTLILVRESVEIGDADPKYRFIQYIYPVREEKHARIECIFPIRNSFVEFNHPTDEQVNKIVNDYHEKWRKGNEHFTEEESNFYWSGINDGAYALLNKIRK